MTKRSSKKKRTRKAVAPSPKVRSIALFAEPWALGWSGTWRILLKVLLIAAAGLWIYWPVLHGGWLWDDDYLLSQNSLIHDPDGIFDIWFAPGKMVDYFPLTTTLEWLEWQFWPNDTFCYHLTSILFHIGNALLVWRLFSKLGIPRAWLGGLIFAIHPVLVESVAWMAELKNTVSMTPFLLAMSAWIDYERRSKADDYLLALTFFVVAMLCKTSMVMFPVVILLYAWYLRGRIEWRDLKHTIAFLAISIVLTLAVIADLHHGVGEESIPIDGLVSRIACAGLSLSFYFSKCFLPVGLSPIYPQWLIDPPSPMQFLFWPIEAGVIYWLWTKRQTWGRHALFGVGFFLINLAPFVGFRTISFMRVTWVMDHLLYLPILGLLGLAVAALGQVDERLNATQRLYGRTGAAIVAILLTIGSHLYAKVYISSEALWSYTILHHPQAWAAHNDLGNALSDEGRVAEAKVQYEEALAINPNYPEARNDLGVAYIRMGRVQEAAAQFQEALRLCPDLGSAQDNLRKVQDYEATHPPQR